MIEMFKGTVNSPVTELKESISAQATVIKVNNINAFPDGPNLAVIGTDENAETIKYATKTTNALSGCQRGVEGIAKVWNAGEKIARNFTNKDHADLVDNVKELNESKASTQEVEGLRQTVNQKASTVALQELSDKVNTLERKPSGLEVADGVYNNNFISIDDFTPKDGVPFLLNMFRVPRDNMQIDANTRIGFGRGEPLILTMFNDVIFHDAMQVKQKQFICIKKEDKVWIEVYSSELDNKILELQQRVEQAFQSANNAKNQLVEAIIGMGGSASTSESFSELIRKLEDSAEEREAFNSRMVEIYFPSGVNEKGSAKMLYDKAVSISGRRYAYLFKPPRVLKNEFSKCDSVRVRVIFGEFTGNGYPFKLYLSDADGKALVDISTIDIGDYNEGTDTAEAYVRNWNTKTWSENLENIRVAIEFEFTEFYGVDPLGKGMPALALNLLDVSVEKLEVYFER